MYFFKLVFITQPKYLDTFLSNALRVAIGQLRISSHQLEIENGPTNRFAREEMLCRLCVKDRIRATRMRLTRVKELHRRKIDKLKNKYH